MRPVMPPLRLYLRKIQKRKHNHSEEGAKHIEQRDKVQRHRHKQNSGDPRAGNAGY